MKVGILKYLLTYEIEFKREAKEIIKSSISENHQIDNVVLELNAIKFAYNTTFVDCIKTFLVF